MRESLRRSLAHAGSVAGEVVYPKGSIVVCVACGAPLYKLIASIWLSEGAGKSRWKFVPVTVEDLAAIVARVDLDAGLRANVKFKFATTDAQRQHCASIVPLADVPQGSFAPNCPSCQKPYAYSRSVETAEINDRAGVIELNTIPPVGHARPLTMAGGR